MSAPSSPELTYQHPAFSLAEQPARRRVSLVIEHAGFVKAVALTEGPGLVVGRAAPAEVVIDDKSLSRSHARFTLRGGFVHVEDLGSTHGIHFDGSTVRNAQLEEGDTVSLAAVQVTVSGLPERVAAQQICGFGAFRDAGRRELERASLLGLDVALLAVRSAEPDESLLERLPPLLRSIDLLSEDTRDLSLVLLPETPASQAVEVGRRLLQRLGASLACAVVAYPVDGTDLETLIERAVHASRGQARGTVERVTKQAPEGSAGAPVIVSLAMQKLYGLVDRIAHTTLPVLVLGETGSGKELVSRAVHERSPRKGAPFVAVNCASIPQQLVESVLFGHERGAFTGASEKRAGVFEQAQGGSVFLDEVGELSPAVQAALLRVLETKRVTRVGSTKELEVDVRIVAATHRDLAAMVAAGTFREDLMFRLDALRLRVPPLRERLDEVEPLSRRFLEQARTQWGARARDFDPEALRALRAYAWPGNVRQLKNVVERAAVVCLGGNITLDDLPDVLLEAPEAPSVPETYSSPRPTDAVGPTVAQGSAETDPQAPFESRVRAFEARLIGEALARHGGSHTKAAAELGMPRRTLSNKVAALKGG